MQHCANFFWKWYEFLPLLLSQINLRCGTGQVFIYICNLADENALMQFCLVLKKGIFFLLVPHRLTSLFRITPYLSTTIPTKALE